MKIKFNQYERVAGLFVLAAVVGAIATLGALAVQKGWFEAKIKYTTSLRNAEGIREGTVVQIAGLRAGSVTHVELRANNEIIVQLEIAKKFDERIREESRVRAVRPFVIGEKVLEISVASDSSRKLVAGESIQSEATTDMMDFVSGKSMGASLESLNKILENVKTIADALLDPQRTKAIVQMVDDLSPLVKNASTLSKEAVIVMHDVNEDKRLSRMIANLDVMTSELAKLTPQLAHDTPELASDMKKIAKNMAVLTDELQKTLPMLQEIGPEVPRASRRAMEALDETVVTLKALQKSFLLRGSVRDVKEEEAREQRLPASK